MGDKFQAICCRLYLDPCSCNTKKRVPQGGKESVVETKHKCVMEEFFGKRVSWMDNICRWHESSQVASNTGCRRGQWWCGQEVPIPCLATLVVAAAVVLASAMLAMHTLIIIVCSPPPSSVKVSWNAAKFQKSWGHRFGLKATWWRVTNGSGQWPSNWWGQDYNMNSKKRWRKDEREVCSQCKWKLNS